MSEQPAGPDGATDVSRETSTESSRDVSRETPIAFDTPIAREAAQAVHVLNVRQEQWPREPETLRGLAELAL